MPKSPAIIALLPMFRDTAHSPAMVKQGMDIIAQTTGHVNSGQIPVLTADQPLYAIAKKNFRWTWPEKYGETQYNLMVGGLHIEMAMLSVIGEWLDGSGWTCAMTVANVTTEGRAIGLQRGLHISKHQWAHQVTAAALFQLLNRSYTEYNARTAHNFEEWCKYMASTHPQFDYWQKVLQFKVLFLQFMRSLREQRFMDYVESLGKIIPWMFALDHSEKLFLGCLLFQNYSLEQRFMDYVESLGKIIPWMFALGCLPFVYHTKMW